MKHGFTLCMIVLAAAISGCICFSGQHTPQATVSATPTAVSPQASPTMVTTTVQAVQPPHPFDIDQAQWMDYQQTDGTRGPSDVRLEYSASSTGGASVKTVKRTVSYSNSGSDSGYSYDPTTNKLHFGTTNSSSYSSTSIGASIDQMVASDPVLAADDLSYSLIGHETVTVPKGTYQCDKYTADLNGAQVTYWAAAGIPVPIKVMRGNEVLALSDYG